MHNFAQKWWFSLWHCIWITHFGSGVPNSTPAVQGPSGTSPQPRLPWNKKAIITRAFHTLPGPPRCFPSRRWVNSHEIVTSHSKYQLGIWSNSQLCSIRVPVSCSLSIRATKCGIYFGVIRFHSLLQFSSKNHKRNFKSGLLWWKEDQGYCGNIHRPSTRRHTVVK